jgi:uncharacterized protein with von Willebrand factor type A (vWA) domain
VVFVGDAAMSPYEITHSGGSVEHWNEEAGSVWLQRVADIYEHIVWLNPTPERQWGHSPSTQLIRQLIGERMFPMTLDGLDRAMKELAR